MTSIKQIARVLPGHRVEVVAPELAEGDLVDVVLLPRTTGAISAQSAVAFLDALPDGPRAFATWEDYEQHLQQEKDAWER
jgi:hypothetical protein